MRRLINISSALNSSLDEADIIYLHSCIFMGSYAIKTGVLIGRQYLTSTLADVSSSCSLTVSACSQGQKVNETVILYGNIKVTDTFQFTFLLLFLSDHIGIKSFLGWLPGAMDVTLRQNAGCLYAGCLPDRVLRK